MKCEQARNLLSRLRADARLEDCERRALLEHLADCRRCRREAVELEPWQVFLGAAAVDPEAAEIERIHETVQSMRRLRELEEPSSRSGRRARWTAAAGILLAAVFLSPSGEPRRESPAGEQAADVQLSPAQRPSAQEFVRVSAWGDTSIIENLDRPGARVYQLTEQDLSVVMIVDESLDL